MGTKFFLKSQIKAGVFFTMSKTDCHLLHQNFHQRISVIPKNWHFNLCFVLKTTKTPYVLIKIFLTIPTS